MNTEYLKYILEIASCQSINQAAENLCFKRQYLSKILGNVEDQFGAVIFKRTPQGVTLTQDGQYFIEHAQNILRELEQMEQHFRQKNSSYPQYTDAFSFFSPNISYSNSTLLDVIDIFRQQFPNVDISIVTKSTSDIVDAIKADPHAPGAFLSHEVLNDPLADNISVHLLEQIPIVAVASSKNAAAQRYKIISLQELFRYDIVCYEPDAEYSRTIFPADLIKILEPHIKHRVNSPNIFHNFLEQKQCFSLSIGLTSSPKNILQIPLKEQITTNLYLAFHRSALDCFPIKAFINTVLAHFERPLLNEHQ